MPRATPETTTVSSKGQMVLPKSLRDRRNWGAGTRLVVEETEDGVMLRRAPAFARTDPEEVFATLRRDRPAVSLEEMEAAVLRQAQQGHDRD